MIIFLNKYFKHKNIFTMLKVDNYIAWISYYNKKINSLFNYQIVYFSKERKGIYTRKLNNYLLNNSFFYFSYFCDKSKKHFSCYIKPITNFKNLKIFKDKINNV